MIAKLKYTLKNDWFLWLLMLLFCGLYLFNISGWLIHDDEGTDLYEVWQLQLGHQPGIDFIAEQQPLFLLIGKTALNLFENDVLALRTISVLQVLGGAFFLGWVVRKIWGNHLAAITVGVTLSSGVVYEQARLFRPDPMMFGWELIGLGLVLLAVHNGKRPLRLATSVTAQCRLYWGLAGAAYGIAVLMKLFGIFPIIGLVFFFLYLFYKEPSQWQKHLQNGIMFAVPFLLVSIAGSLLLYSNLGFYYQEVFNQHLSLGQSKTVRDQLYITGGTYLSFILVNAVTIFIFPLVILNKRSGEVVIQHPEKALLYTQLLVPLLFVFITRPIFPRYHIFLLPILALLLAIQMNGIFNKIDQNQPRAASLVNLLVLLFIGFAYFATFPSITKRLTRTEEDTLALAEFLQARTSPEDIIVSDYASLNFHAKRPSIYEASIIAGGRIGGGIVTGDLLIERMEETEAQLFLIHVEGGSPKPHQLINLIDFSLFEAYLAENYEMIEVFDRANQLIEIYERR
ncbi:MAG: hypothetical protein GY805_33700 [Chloroflexi bacterium]|nr:hypothetical protein [Chloroflexota bacterium]